MHTANRRLLFNQQGYDATTVEQIAEGLERAVALIQLGARLQVLESETSLSYERLLRLYKEVAGKSPSKGQLPFSNTETCWMSSASVGSHLQKW